MCIFPIFRVFRVSWCGQKNRFNFFSVGFLMILFQQIESLGHTLSKKINFTSKYAFLRIWRDATFSICIFIGLAAKCQASVLVL